MADQPITTGAGSLGASGANVLLRFLSTQIVRGARIANGPLRFISDVSGDLATVGQSVGVYVSPSKTSRLLTDGSAKVLDDDTGSTVNVTLNKQRYSAMSITTIARAMAGDMVAMALLQEQIAAVVNGVQEDVFSVAASSFTTNTAVGTYNTALTEAVAQSSVSALLNQKIPGPFFGLVHTNTKSWGALTQLASFSNAQYIGQPSPLVDPRYGNGRLWHGAFWFYTQAMPIASGTNTSNLVFAPSAMAVAMRIPGSSISGNVRMENVVDPESGIAVQIVFQWDKDRLADEVIVRCLYGYAVVKDAYGIELKS